MRGDLKDAALNLEAIQRAVVQHNGNCEFSLEAIEMNQLEVDRLGWDDFRGIPIRANNEVATLAFRLVCSGQKDPLPPVAAQVETEEPLEVQAPEREKEEVYIT